jgi:hypothetical protein
MAAPDYSVFKDTVTNTIAVTVTVYPPSPGGTCPQVRCPTFLVPGTGPWTIVWDLVSINDPLRVDDPKARYAAFEQGRGVALFLGQRQNFTAEKRVSDTQWAVSFTNDGRDVVESLGYEIRFTYGEENALFSTTNRQVLHHDPSRVVSKDPVEPLPPDEDGEG